MLQIKILADTVLKLRPAQSSQLSDAEKQTIVENTVLAVESYAIEGDHLKVAFADKFFKGRNTWYVYAYHAQLIKDGAVVPTFGTYVKILVNTFLKLKPLQTTQLKDEEKQLVQGGSVYQVQSYAVENDHLKIALINQFFKGRNTWYVYQPQAQIIQTGQDDEPEQSQGSKVLTEEDYRRAAAMITVPVATIKAVISVETSGSGFLPDGRPKILFEAHYFSYYTGRRYDTSHPNISSRSWNRNLYVGGAGEYNRLNEAISLNRTAALMSASWGLGQIMGDNFRAAGYSTVDAFVKDMSESAGKQLIAMINFIKANNFDDALRRQDWASFAYGYNGPGYKANRYDEKMRQAFLNFSRRA